MFGRLRRYIRQNTLPIKPEVAWHWKTRLSIAYAFLGWHIIGITVYLLLKDKMGGQTSSADYAKLLGITNARVIKFSNAQKTDEYDLNIKEEDIDEYHKENKEKKDENDKYKPSTGYWNRRWADDVQTQSVLNANTRSTGLFK